MEPPDRQREAEQAGPLLNRNGATTEEAESGWKSLSLREKVRYVASNVTVEPMLAMHAIPYVLTGLAVQNMNLEKACRVNLGYSDLVCDALAARDTANFTFQEAEVQKLTARMAGWKVAVQSALPCLLILFVGSWSDRHGCRKPFMLIPIVGEFLTIMGLLVCTYFFKELPVEAAVFCEAFFPAIAGGWFFALLGVFTYIAEVTTVSERTLRVGIVSLTYSVSNPIGMALSGVLYRLIGFYGVFSLAAVMYVCAFTYGYLRLHDKPKTRTKDKPSGVLGHLRDLFDLQVLVETVRESLKSGPNHRRLRVMLLLVTAALVVGPYFGETTVMYLYVRKQFNWDELNFSIFSTFVVVMNLLGTALTVGVFSSVLKVDDGVIGMMSCGLRIAADFIFTFAVNTTMLYSAPVVDMMGGTSFIAMRAITSKMVPSNELGRVNSLIGVFEALMPFVCALLYSKIYQMTIEVLPGAFFLISASFMVPCFFIFGFYYLESRKSKKQDATSHG